MDSEKEKILDTIFSKQFNFSANWSIIADSVKIISCKKNTSIRLPNKLERNLFFLQSGATGSILFKKNKLICVDICLANDFFGDYQSLITNQASPLEIVAITDCTYLSIPFDKLLLVYAQHPDIEMERIGRLSAEYLYVLKNSEIMDIKTLSAKERYVKLYARKPEVIQQIPVKYIAAYLGITAESMSRIRKEVGREHLLS